VGLDGTGTPEGADAARGLILRPCGAGWHPAGRLPIGSQVTNLPHKINPSIT
jgi:hypothetical protein